MTIISLPPEVEEALGIKIGPDWNKLCSAGAEIVARMNLMSLVITRGRDGMVLVLEHADGARRS